MVIVSVFDPLAITLILAANFAFGIAFPKQEKKYQIYKKEDELIEEPTPKEEPEIPIKVEKSIPPKKEPKPSLEALHNSSMPMDDDSDRTIGKGGVKGI